MKESRPREYEESPDSSPFLKTVRPLPAAAVSGGKGNSTGSGWKMPFRPVGIWKTASMTASIRFRTAHRKSEMTLPYGLPCRKENSGLCRRMPVLRHILCSFFSEHPGGDRRDRTAGLLNAIRRSPGGAPTGKTSRGRPPDPACFFCRRCTSREHGALRDSTCPGSRRIFSAFLPSPPPPVSGSRQDPSWRAALPPRRIRPGICRRPPSSLRIPGF